MRISRLAVRRPVTTLMTFIAVVVLGLVSYQQLPMQLIPDITIPTVGVFMQKPGGSPEDTLESLTKPVEGILAELPRIKKIESWTGTWGTWVRADFEQGTDIRFTTIDLQERLNSFQQNLEDRRTEIQVFPFTTDSFKNFLMALSVEGPLERDQLYDVVRDKVEPQLKGISGVAKVEVGGLATDAADVEIDADRLAGFGLNFEMVFGRIQRAANDETFLGTLDVPGENHYVRLNDPVRNIEELRKIPVDDKGVVTLEDVASVTEGAALEGYVFRSNGNYAIGINLEREEGENMIRLAQTVRGRIAEINEVLPQGTQVKIDTDIARIVEDVIRQVRNLALIGAALALIVPMVFFRSWRVSSIIFASVPICIIAVFNLFYAFGMSINIFSIIGLALGVGMLVDNSIVVVENCFRLYFSRHIPALEAAARGGDEVGRALFASTLTSVVPFIPFLFIDGEFKLFVKEPALALVFPLLISLLVALTLSAMLASKILQSVVRHRGARGEAEFDRAARHFNPSQSRMREVYRFILKACLRHRGRVLAVVGLLLAFVMLEACDTIREANASREGNEQVFRVYLKMPPGTLTSEASHTVSFVEDRLVEHEDIERFGVWFRQDQATFDIQLLEEKKRPSGRTLASIRQSMPDFIGEVPGGEVSLTRSDQPGADEVLQSGTTGQLVLKGLDQDTIEQYAARLIESIRALPDVIDAEIRTENPQPEYQALIDREKARLFGVNAQTLGQYIGATRAGGTISSLVLKDGEDRTDVTISFAGADIDTVAQIQDMTIYSPLGSSVPLGELTNFRAAQTPGRISRQDRQSSLFVDYTWVPGADAGNLLTSIRNLINALPNPAGIVTEFEGQQRQLQERQQDFLFVLLAAVVLIYVVMAAVFESYWVPFTILLTNPLMIIGIVAALAITKLPFDELAAFGVILLNGLAVNNGIVLMDTALRYRVEKGYRRSRAVFQAADQRLRPIVMTFLTTTLGLLPLAISGGESSQWRPVAVTVLGGLSSATFLMLLVLPCMYLIGDDFVTWARPYWVGAWRTVFLAFERVTNGLVRGIGAVVTFWRWHPLRWPAMGWRGLHWAVPRLFRRLPVSLWRAGGKVLRGGGRLIRQVAGDGRTLLSLAVRRQRFDPSAKIEELAPEPRAATEASNGPALDLQNLHVLYPTDGWRRIPRLLPGEGYPFGHRPRQGVEALSGVSLRIESGLYGLLGPNGAGKTTLMRCIAGLLEPTRGTVRVFGVSQRDAGEQLAPLIGYLPQNHGHYDWMTLYEYLDFFAMLTARTLRRVQVAPETNPHLSPHLARLDRLASPGQRLTAIHQAAAEVHLEGELNERIGTFSGGMRQRAGIARVLLQAPPILIVDEPTAGLDPVERVKVRVLLAKLAQTRAVLFSTHIVEDLEESCQAVAVLDQGRLLFQGSPRELRGAWRDQVWEIPLNGEDPERLREGISSSGGTILFRYVRGDSAGWRALSPAPPHPRATNVEASLEDALLGVLGGDGRS